MLPSTILLFVLLGQAAYLTAAYFIVDSTPQTDTKARYCQNFPKAEERAYDHPSYDVNLRLRESLLLIPVSSPSYR